ncbi:MAG: DNA polymerase III subunit delta' [Eubacteriales bacterium]
MFENIIIKDGNKKILRNAIHHHQLSHCYMFIGPEGTYKTKTAIAFIKGILCKSHSDTKPCDCCTSCHKINHKNHPDILWVSPIDNSIKISQIREMQRVMKIKPYESSLKIFIVDHCETMGLPAQNALLKSLEEPNKSVMIILLCKSKDKIIPTILSRCQRLTFNPASKNDFYNYMKEFGVDENELKEYYTVTQGCLGKVEMLLDDPDTLKRFVLMKGYINRIFQGETQEIFALSKWIKDAKYPPLEITSYIIIILRDLLYDIIISGDSHNNITHKLSCHVIHDIIINMVEIQSSLTNNINLQVQVERVLLKIQEEITIYDKGSWNTI